MEINDYLKEFWEAVDAEMASRNDSDYEVNQPQMQKLIEAYSFFKRVADTSGGTVEPFKISPKAVHGGVTAYYTLFYLTGEDLKKLASIMGNMSAISIDSMANGDVCISFNVPNVFRKKSST